MRVRIAKALVLVAASVLVGGCGGDDAKPKASGLGWAEEPQVFTLRDLPSDRVLIGEVQNNGTKPLHLSAGRLVVRDASGRRLKSSAAYTSTFSHGLFGAFQQPSKIPQPEASRLGHDIYLIPKDKRPFFAAWRIPSGSQGPFRIEYGSGPPLEVPARTKPAAR